MTLLFNKSGVLLDKKPGALWSILLRCRCGWGGAGGGDLNPLFDAGWRMEINRFACEMKV
jgi:hypothetical protein